MARTTKAEVEAAFKRFVDGLTHNGAPAPEGYHYALDYAGPYGGYLIVLVQDSNGARWTPFGHQRRKAGDFVDTLRFAGDTMRQIEKSGQLFG
jgi:hypothetical protein